MVNKSKFKPNVKMLGNIFTSSDIYLQLVKGQSTIQNSRIQINRLKLNA